MIDKEKDKVLYWLDQAERQLLLVIDTLAKYDDDFVLRHDVRGKAGLARGAIELARKAYERKQTEKDFGGAC